MKVKLIENDEFGFSSMKTLIQHGFGDHFKNTVFAGELFFLLIKPSYNG